MRLGSGLVKLYEAGRSIVPKTSNAIAVKSSRYRFTLWCQDSSGCLFVLPKHLSSLDYPYYAVF
jgi:hypothetical protein